MKQLYILCMLLALLFPCNAIAEYNYHMSNATNTVDTQIPKFIGTIWYVDADIAASGAGQSPETSFKTIGEAITAASAGDAITVKSGTYTETGLDLNQYGQEIWFEIGALIQPATGTALTVSGSSCKIKGMCKIIPAA